MKPDPFFEYLRDRATISKELYKEPSPKKNYDRFPHIVLPTPRELGASISSAIQSRESIRDYLDKGVSLQKISDLLFWSAGFSGKKSNGKAKPSYPSGGEKYPIELYVCILKEGDLSTGAYHYDATTHQLTRLLSVDMDKFPENIIGEDLFVKKSGMVVIFSYRKSRSFGKYGNVAYKLALIESGAICQNMYLICPLIGLGCCALGVVQEGIEEFLHYDEDEFVVYKMAVGNLK